MNKVYRYFFSFLTQTEKAFRFTDEKSQILIVIYLDGEKEKVEQQRQIEVNLKIEKLEQRKIYDGVFLIYQILIYHNTRKCS